MTVGLEVSADPSNVAYTIWGLDLGSWEERGAVCSAASDTNPGWCESFWRRKEEGRKVERKEGKRQG